MFGFVASRVRFAYPGDGDERDVGRSQVAVVARVSNAHPGRFAANDGRQLSVRATLALHQGDGWVPGFPGALRLPGLRGTRTSAMWKAADCCVARVSNAHPGRSAANDGWQLSVRATLASHQGDVWVRGFPGALRVPGRRGRARCGEVTGCSCSPGKQRAPGAVRGWRSRLGTRRANIALGHWWRLASWLPGCAALTRATGCAHRLQCPAGSRA